MVVGQKCFMLLSEEFRNPPFSLLSFGKFLNYLQKILLGFPCSVCSCSLSQELALAHGNLGRIRSCRSAGLGFFLQCESGAILYSEPIYVFPGNARFSCAMEIES